MTFLETVDQGFLSVVDAIAFLEAGSFHVAELSSVSFHGNAMKAGMQSGSNRIRSFHVSDVLGVFHEAMNISIVGVLFSKLNIMITLMIWVKEA